MPNFNRGFVESLDPPHFEGEDQLEILEGKIRDALYKKFGDDIYKDPQLRRLNEAVGLMILRARDAANKAVQYRDFKVGCAVLSLRDGFPQVNEGYNIMPHKGGAKLCAEQAALSSVFSNILKEEPSPEILGILVAGEQQPDSVSGLNPPTLHPCANCRELVTTMLDIGKNDKSKVMLFTVGLKDDKFEAMTWEEFLELHKNQHSAESL